MAQTCHEDAGKRFFILGVIHRDNRGAELLKKWLSNIAPEVITLEFSDYGMAFRKKRGMEYKKRLQKVLGKMNDKEELFDEEALSYLLSFINMPYEYEVVSGYSEKCNASLYLIDMDDFSYIRLQKIDELFEEGNIRQLLYGKSAIGVNNEKFAARLFFEKGIKVFPYTDEMCIRDRHMSNRISALMERHKQARFLHVCGWQHLQDPYGLYVNLNPIKVFLYDKAICV